MEYTQKTDFLKINFSAHEAFLFSAKVKDVLAIYYVAVRGRDKEEGAVQRVLNKRRISDIKDFILDGNMFLNTFILNWTQESLSPIIENDRISLPLINAAAQVIDGQHRLEGLKLACQAKPEIGDKEIIIFLTKNLSTKEAAKIFININTEQKPVPQSLVYDLMVD